jgi:DNA-binding NtrC family response regulator
VNEQQPRVLVVEDQEAVRLVLQRVLSKNGMDVELAAGGEEALLRLKRGPEFHVMVADLLMPGVHGAAFLRLAAELAPKLPVIVLTGSGISRATLQASGCKVFQYLRKPLETKRLLEAVHAAYDHVLGGM